MQTIEANIITKRDHNKIIVTILVNNVTYKSFSWVEETNEQTETPYILNAILFMCIFHKDCSLFFNIKNKNVIRSINKWRFKWEKNGWNNNKNKQLKYKSYWEAISNYTKAHNVHIMINTT